MKQYTLICRHTSWVLNIFTSLRELNLEYSPTVREGLRREGFELKCYNLTPVEYSYNQKWSLLCQTKASTIDYSHT